MVNVNVDEVVKNHLPEFKTILTLLEEKYPEQVITASSSLNDIMFRAGQRSVLLHFREVITRVEAQANTEVIKEA